MIPTLLGRSSLKRIVVLTMLSSAGALAMTAVAFQAPAGGGQPAAIVVEIHTYANYAVPQAARLRANAQVVWDETK